MKAVLKNYRQSPRKVRLVTDLVKGKSAERALVELKYVNKKATQIVEKLLKSAMANAKENNRVSENLVIKDLRVDEGPTLKRIKPRARGAAFPVRKRTSRITLVLEEKQAKARAKTGKTQQQVGSKKIAEKKNTPKMENKTTSTEKVKDEAKPSRDKTKPKTK